MNFTLMLGSDKVEVCLQVRVCVCVDLQKDKQTVQQHTHNNKEEQILFPNNESGKSHCCTPSNNHFQLIQNKMTLFCLCLCLYVCAHITNQLENGIVILFQKHMPYNKSNNQFKLHLSNHLFEAKQNRLENYWHSPLYRICSLFE